MTNPLGRFEFRVWGKQLGPFRDRLAAIAAPSEPHESAETYILSRTTDAANAKIRAGLLQIKLMFEQVGRLERWRPALKSEFPLDSRTIVEQVFPHLAVATPHIAQPSYTHVEFVRDLVRPHPDLAIVDVVKMRGGSRRKNTSLNSPKSASPAAPPPKPLPSNPKTRPGSFERLRGLA